jgi:hypothetical protein
LADDAVEFGSLDKISAFPYENFMQVLKRLIMAKRNELPQVIRRVYEKQQNEISNLINEDRKDQYVLK